MGFQNKNCAQLRKPHFESLSVQKTKQTQVYTISVVTQSHKIPNFMKNFLIFSTKKKSSLVFLKPTGQTDTNKRNSVKGRICLP